MKTAEVRAEPEKLLKHILPRLRRRSASAVRLIDIADIVVDERVRLKCRIPLCDSYGRNLMCPPFVPSVEFFRDALSRYEAAFLIQVRAPLPEVAGKDDRAEIYAPAKKLHELVNLAEKWAFERKFRFAAGLIGGCCRLCEECVAVNGGNRCRNPFKARPSMEAMGIDVVETAIKAGLSTSFPISEEVTWTGLLLV
ncbi:MAG: DUF2284 domain-containing protein [Syntrophales bacterium]|nr:DUF2284 domain-containing protein [Syntrophales bacterium]